MDYHHDIYAFTVLDDPSDFGDYKCRYYNANDHRGEFEDRVKTHLNSSLILYGSRIFNKIKEECNRKEDNNFLLKDADKDILKNYTDKDLFFANIYEKDLMYTKALDIAVDIEDNLKDLNPDAEIEMLKRGTDDEYIPSPNHDELDPGYEAIGRIAGTDIFFGILDDENNGRVFKVLLNPDRTEVKSGEFKNAALSMSFDLEANYTDLKDLVIESIDNCIVQSYKAEKEEKGQEVKDLSAKEIIGYITEDLKQFDRNTR